MCSLDINQSELSVQFQKGQISPIREQNLLTCRRSEDNARVESHWQTLHKSILITIHSQSTEGLSHLITACSHRGVLSHMLFSLVAWLLTMNAGHQEGTLAMPTCRGWDWRSALVCARHEREKQEFRQRKAFELGSYDLNIGSAVAVPPM